ncbi:MAG: hypothetical protein ACKV22_24435 [Bryobacteraceae bacterium]
MRWWAWAIGLLVSWRVFFSPPIFHDESWFLQVVTRTAQGEALYREVFYNTTPLAVWVAWPFHALGAGRLLGLRLLLALAFGVTLWFTVRISRQLAAGPVHLWIVATVVIGLQHFSYYTPISVTFLMACFSFALSYWDGRREATRWLALAAVAAACAFLTKYNVGTAALAALLLAVVLNPAEPAKGRAAAAAVSVFASTTGLMLLPLAASWSAFIDYVFLNKTAYLSSGLGQFRPAWEVRSVLVGLDPWRAIPEVMFHSPLLLLLAPLALVLVWLAGRRAREERSKSIVVAGFVAAGASILFPQLALPHLIGAAPILLAGLQFAGSRIPIGRPLVVLACAWLAGAFMWTCLRPIPQLIRGQWVLMAEHPYSGMWINRDHYLAFRNTVDALRRSGASPFLLTYDAGSLYLATGLRNPTPFDVPAGTAMGRHGEQQVIAAVEAGRVRSVCLNTRWPGDNSPRRLIAYVKNHLRRGEPMGSCVIYWRDH